MEVKKLGDICESLDNKRIPISKEKREPGSIPYYGATGIVDHVKDYIFDEKLLLVGEDGADWSANANTAYIINGKSWVNNHAHVLRCTKINDVFLKEYLNYQDFSDLVGGSTRGKLTKGDLEKILVPFPSLNTQQKIVSILSSIDESIKKTDQLIEKTEKLKNGLIIDIFSKKQEYKKVKINTISDITSSKRIMVSDYVENGIPFYRSTEIIKKSKNIKILNDIFITKEKFNEIKAKFGAPQKNDILVSSVGTIGDIYLVQDEEFYFKDGNLLWIRDINQNILPMYLKTILSSKLYRDKLNIIAGGSSQKALTIEKFGVVEINVPSIEEQKNICDIIGTIDSKLNIEKHNKLKLLTIKNGLMNDIFSQKVEVN